MTTLPKIEGFTPLTTSYKVNVLVSPALAQDLRAEADARGETLADVIRDRLTRTAGPPPMGAPVATWEGEGERGAVYVWKSETAKEGR